MATLTQKKSDAISKLVSLAPTAMTLAANIKELQSYFTDNGFLTGGGNAIVDGDCTGENAHMDAASVNASVTAIATLALSTGNATTLRKASKNPVPGT